MKIHNIRLGFATNSSSSHSFIFDPNLKNVADDYDGDFGWDFFTLVSKQAKSQYMAAMLSQNLSRDVNDRFTRDIIRLILKGLDLPANVTTDSDMYGYNSYIDHQSLYLLPAEFGSRSVSIQFFNEFYEYMMRDGVLILGGNDNSDYSHPLADSDKEITFPGYTAEYGNWVCRKDNDWWVLYNKVNGNRAVFSFKDDPAPFTPLTPMLVDFKLTDWCDAGCEFCYMNSTTAGKHIDKNKLYSFVNDLANAQVFEISVAGGEPTKCPDFLLFLQELNRVGITANFTTKSLDWLEDRGRADQILGLIGAFALSASAVTEIERVLDIFKYRKYSISKFTVQLIPAVLSEYTFERILKFCRSAGIRVTLLGFKEVGRGVEFKTRMNTRFVQKFDESTWLNVIQRLSKTHECPALSIDTTLANRYVKQLEALDIPTWLYHVEEGKYSAYIDSVENKFGPSSYHLDKLIDYNENNCDYNKIKHLFSKIEVVS